MEIASINVGQEIENFLCLYEFLELVTIVDPKENHEIANRFGIGDLMLHVRHLRQKSFDVFNRYVCHIPLLSSPGSFNFNALLLSIS